MILGIIIIGTLIVQYLVKYYEYSIEGDNHKLSLKMCDTDYTLELEQAQNYDRIALIYVSISHGNEHLFEGTINDIMPVLKADTAYHSTCEDSVYSLIDRATNQVLFQFNLKNL